jgi:hypothetical protein
MNPKTKATCRKLYKKFKYGVIGVGYSALIAEEGKQLVVDISKGQLVKYGYRKIALAGLYPLFQTVAWYLYVFTSFKKAKLVALALSQISAESVKTAINLSGVSYIALDLVFCGEIVLLTDEWELRFVKNETTVIEDFVNLLGENEEKIKNDQTLLE